MPMNRTASSAAMYARVEAAFLASGGWNAGTPVAMASVPVRATAPAAKARSSRINESGWRTPSALRHNLFGCSRHPRPRTTIRNVPTTIMSRAENTNR